MKSRCFYSVSTQEPCAITLVRCIVNVYTGAGESGKSTILKQMKLIHEGGYSRDERESFKEIIFSNTVQSMRVILEAMESLELPLDDQRAEYHVQTIFMQPQQIEGDNLPPEVGNAIANQTLALAFDNKSQFEFGMIVPMERKCFCFPFEGNER